MGIIKVMDDSLANKIAAGEVVERIANVVKELVENSIDAESKNIKIELTLSGTKSIKVTDNGVGMDESDALLAFERHATSKIKNENDLYFINTLGFRGEALASIASVSDIVLITCKKDIGTKVTLKGGKIIKKERDSAKIGTSIEVNNLFYNTPARLKFLKSLNTELFYVTNVVEGISLSHPEISFSLYNDGTEVLKTSGSNDLLKVIHEIYGYNVSKNMHYISESNYDYSIKGYIGNINISKSNSNGMICIVNNRIIKNQALNRMIRNAYHTFLPDNKYPIIVLLIDTDPTLIDVNIHPTKQDIKFSKIDSLENLLYDAIRDKLNETDNTFKYTEEIENKEYMVKEDIVLSFDEEEFEIKKEDKSLINPTDLVFGTYLVAQNEEKMFLIDIHAANERINYERYLKALKEKKQNTISLLLPINIEMKKSEYLIIKENENVLKNIGIETEDFGINTLRIISHPTWIKEGYEEESIRKIIDLIFSLKGKFDVVKFNENVAITLACKMSIKANSTLSQNEKEELLKKLFACEFPYTCPHGRPTIVEYPKYELEKLFKRVV